MKVLLRRIVSIYIQWRKSTWARVLGIKIGKIGAGILLSFEKKHFLLA
ncbi:hypothetical protein B6N60_05087 [Richelia sinica FACHB-800]|uniref:Uncharacterized protein n=1 Tax=Richelia sinica FACHB-800 TaxID=1357546 RepID=A0A975Y7I2_9NOST|nr:hypothetical protein B6N60_05087 [Richelia sinica FACHB-800]